MTDEGPGGVVSAATPEAAEAGCRVLEEGGNAVDAAVATSLALCVTEPAGSGLGGQLSLVLQAPDHSPVAINGSSRAPAAIPDAVSAADLAGHRASTVPTHLRVLDHVWRRHGSGRISWSRLMEPALSLATEGYALGEFRRKALVRHAQAIRSRGITTKLLLPDGRIPEVGTIMRQPILGRTLHRISEQGAEDFYQGELARAIAEDMRSNEGWITAEDLASVEAPTEVDPVLGSYRGFDVATLPPPASGWVVVLALNLLEQVPEGELAVEGPDRLIWLAQILSLTHRYRIQRPVPDIEDYHDAVATRTSKERAKKLASALVRYERGETTHFTVVDGDGLVVAATQSLNAYYGAKVAAPGLGFFYNDYMREFVLDLDKHPFALRPGGMPYSSMSPTILARRGIPVLGAGSPGDERIISAVIQVISHWVDVTQGIEAAVAAPRLHTLRGEEVLFEAPPTDAGTLVALERHGFSLYQPLSSLFSGRLSPYFGGVHAVAREETGWQGAADPRRDGQVAHAGASSS